MSAAIDPADLAEIESINRLAGSSFRLPMRFLPRAKRDGMAVVYALCRVLDDAADADAPAAECRARLDRLAAEVTTSLNGRPTTPLGRALSAVAQAFPIDRAEIEALIAGLRGDIEAPPRGMSRDELTLYCRRVAGAPGLLSLAVLGAKGEATRRFGLALAEAMQMTNILRDTASDARRGRLYLPHDILAAAGIDGMVPAEAVATPAFARARADFASLAAERYGLARRLLDDCDPSPLGLPIAFLILYRDILGRVRATIGSDPWARPRPGPLSILRAILALIVPARCLAGGALGR